MPEHSSLRWGYSTGACAAALALALWLARQQGGLPAHVDVLFLDGKVRRLALAPLPEQPQTAAIYKDGGDDPDCTHGALLYATLQPCAPHEAQAQDYCLPVGNALLIVRAGEGIGLCTRQGLDCDCGKWAITTGPRQMIAANLARAGMQAGCWLLVLHIRHGAELAKKTLNAQLGIVGGLSVLGSTGQERPFSHAAYTKTIWLCTRSHALTGGKHMVFCTGGCTLRGAKKQLEHLPASAFVCIADFIGHSLRAAERICHAARGQPCLAWRVKCVNMPRALINPRSLRRTPWPQEIWHYCAGELHIQFAPECAVFCPQCRRAASVRRGFICYLPPQSQPRRFLRSLAAACVAGFAQKSLQCGCIFYYLFSHGQPSYLFRKQEATGGALRWCAASLSCCFCAGTEASFFVSLASKGVIMSCLPVTIVGAGPGAVDLITVRGRHALEHADVVLYAGSLVNPEHLAFCPPACQCRDSASLSLAEQVDFMAQAALAGKKVVRLHTGDPALYGAINEQILLLAQRGVPVNIVAGVSSVFGAAAALGCELTSPEVSQSVVLTRTAGRTPMPAAEDAAAFARTGATLVFFLSAGKAARN